MERSFLAALLIALLQANVLVTSLCAEDKWMCRDGTCIEIYQLCDSGYDCFDGSDETDAKCSLECSTTEFACHDMTGCLTPALVCNGDDDCFDGSDETVCGGCLTDFMCSDGYCLDPGLVCDGYNDCGDAGDEQDCPGDPFNWVKLVTGYNATEHGPYDAMIDEIEDVDGSYRMHAPGPTAGGEEG